MALTKCHRHNIVRCPVCDRKPAPSHNNQLLERLANGEFDKEAHNENDG